MQISTNLRQTFTLARDCYIAEIAAFSILSKANEYIGSEESQLPRAASHLAGCAVIIGSSKPDSVKNKMATLLALSNLTLMALSSYESSLLRQQP